jgi:hypothetical protein
MTWGSLGARVLTNSQDFSDHRIGLWENLQESPINLMVKTMVSG